MLYAYSDQNSAQRPSLTQNTPQEEIWYKVVAHTKNGHVYHGLCNGLDKDISSLELFLHDKNGAPLNKRKIISLDRLKALFLVKQFDGNHGNTPGKILAAPPVMPIAVQFTDGEIIIGRPVNSDWQSSERIMIRPEDASGNNVLLIVERSSIKNISSLEVYKLQRLQAFNDFARSHFKPGMSQEECIGDYYFFKRDYWRAADYYAILLERTPSDSRIKNKLCVSKYNIGMHHIRNKDFPQALHYMELVLELDPNNKQASEKAIQLREKLRIRTELRNIRSHSACCKDTALMERFVDGAWVKNRQQFILTGQAHSGKSRLACTLGCKISKQDLEVAYYRVPDLIRQILAIKKDGRDIQLMRALERVDFLILDDWQIELFPDEEREEFLEIIADRYKRQATLLIADLPDNHWHRIFGKSTASKPKLNQVLYDALKIHLETPHG